MTFNEKIVLLRKQKGLTQEEVAFKLNISRQALSKWENGEFEPDFKKLKQLSKIYDVSINFLLDDEFDNSLEEKNKDLHTFNDKNFIIHKNTWFIIFLLSAIVLIALILVVAFADFSKYYSGVQFGFVGFITCWTLEIVILKIVILISIIACIFSGIKLFLKGRKRKGKKNENC